jgi:membrane protease YdiL (CAAX protease family)
VIPERLAEMLALYLQRDLLLLGPALVLLYLLRRKTLAGLRPALHSGCGNSFRQSWQGLALAAGSLLLVVTPVWLAGGFSSGSGDFRTFKYLIAVPDGGTWLVLGWLFFVQSLSEELLFRVIGTGCLAWLLFWLFGLVFQRRGQPGSPGGLWLRWLVGGLAANATVSIAFASAHGSNANVSSLALINIALAGLVLGQLFVNSAALWAPWAFHFGWNFGLALLGLPVSGFAFAPAATAFGFSGARTGMLSGGRFGPEGSALATVVLALLFGWLVYAGFRQRLSFTTPRQAGPGEGAEIPPAPV